MREGEFITWRAIAIEQVFLSQELLGRLLVNVLSRYPENPQRGMGVFDQLLRELIRQRANTLTIARGEGNE